jgi:hypothetical protein
MVMPPKRGFRELDDFGGVALTSPAHDIALANKPPNTHLEWLGPPVNAWCPVENGYYVDEQQNKVKGTKPVPGATVTTVTTAPVVAVKPVVTLNWWDQMWTDIFKFFGVK